MQLLKRVANRLLLPPTVYPGNSDANPYDSLISQDDYNRLRVMERHVAATVRFLDREIAFVDACTFLAGLKEIFVNRPYLYKPTDNSPVIIDCGANIGLSVMFFKIQYPNSVVTAFEADPDICECLKSNVRILGFENVNVSEKAVSTCNGVVNFSQHGGFAGRIKSNSDAEDTLSVPVPCQRLRDTLAESETVDFLKIDIEGTEVDVLTDCEPELHRVQNLFVEYHSPVDRTQRLGELLQLLSNSGFRYELKTTFGSRKPFTETCEMGGMDFQCDIFARKVS